MNECIIKLKSHKINLQYLENIPLCPHFSTRLYCILITPLPDMIVCSPIVQTVRFIAGLQAQPSELTPLPINGKVGSQTT